MFGVLKARRRLSLPFFIVYAIYHLIRVIFVSIKGNYIKTEKEIIEKNIKAKEKEVIVGSLSLTKEVKGNLTMRCNNENWKV